MAIILSNSMYLFLNFKTFSRNYFYKKKGTFLQGAFSIEVCLITYESLK